jgi:hypothetical protein
MDDMVKHHPVADPAAVTAPRMTRRKLRRLATATLVQQRTELDPDRLQQA